MDANQRSEINNQTNNGANEKSTPGSEGKTAGKGQPLDHTYPQGSASQQRDIQQPGAGPGVADGRYDRSDAMNQSQVPGGSMASQINGGSGTVQGITDSHQRQMAQTSSAHGVLEQPVGNRPGDSAVNVKPQRAVRSDMQVASSGVGQGNLQSGTQGGGMAGPQGRLPPHAAGGSMGNRQSGQAGAAQGGGMPGPRSGAQGGHEAQAGNTQLGVSGSHSMANQNSDFGGVHESNDVAGGLPRSPGNSGARHAGASTDRAGSQTGVGAADGGPPVRQSNDVAGGYPRSPGGANRLAGDRNMDDDTGFKRKR